MSFSSADYQAAADALGTDVAAVTAVAEVESSGETMWDIGGQPRPPIRLESHWFGKLTGYQFNESHPHISSRKWTPSLAAKTRAGAWAHFEEASSLDERAAIQAVSWGAFQIMGFHYKALDFPTPYEMKAAAFTESGQLDMFVRFIMASPAIHHALQQHDWDAFTARYNGPGQVDVYAPKIRAAYERHA
jgi:hypothetical protein